MTFPRSGVSFVQTRRVKPAHWECPTHTLPQPASELRPTERQLTVFSDDIMHDGTNVVFSADGVREARYCNNTTAPVLIDVRATILAGDATYVYWSDGSMIGRVAK
jgi:hypothetical protein